MAGDFVDESELKLQGIQKYFNSYTKRGRLNWVLATYGTLFGIWATYRMIKGPGKPPPPTPMCCVPCNTKAPPAPPKKQNPCEFLESLKEQPSVPVPPDYCETCVPCARPKSCSCPPTPAKALTCDAEPETPPKKKWIAWEYLDYLRNPPPPPPVRPALPPEDNVQCCSRCGLPRDPSADPCKRKKKKQTCP